MSCGGIAKSKTKAELTNEPRILPFDLANLTHYDKFDKGGHFAAWEQPQHFSDEVRAGVKSLRIDTTTTLTR